jgi:hypothetical protein
MASGTYQPNNAGFQEAALGPEIRAALQAIGEKAKATAEALAQDFRVSGDYASSFVLSESSSIQGRNRRAMVQLENTSPHAAAVEWGNAHDHRAHRVLGRTLDSLRVE